MQFNNLTSIIANEQNNQNQNNIFSTYFLNIDGNFTNFDRQSVELSTLKHKFSVVALAETNLLESDKDQYKLSNEYTPVYSSKINNKSKGSGVALYIRNNFSFTILQEFSNCNTNIETLFIKITNTAEPIIVGVVYRPPSGDIELFNNEIERILSSLPDYKHYIMGDYNINLFDLKSKGQTDFEEIMISNGYLPLISISTHHQAGCQKTCIDNIITNQSTNKILACGKIAGQTSKHSGIFQISSIGSATEAKTEAKIKIEYDYNKENLQKFVDNLFLQLNQTDDQEINCFEKFSEIFQSAIEQTCKLAIPKITKRNSLNNPWITSGIKKSIIINDQLYEDWMDSFKTIDGGDTGLKEKHKKHQKTLRWLIKKVKAEHYTTKFGNCQGDKKKTWKIINELRGKQKQDIKASFIIGNERIVCRRKIAEKFNNYFASLYLPPTLMRKHIV